MTKAETHEVLWKAHGLLSNIDYLARKYEAIDVLAPLTPNMKDYKRELELTLEAHHSSCIAQIVRELDSGDALDELEKAMEAYDEEVSL